MKFESTTSLGRGPYSQPIPEEWKGRLEKEVTVEDMYSAKTDLGRGWVYEKGGKGFTVPVMRHYGWERSHEFPDILQEMLEHTNCKDISMFISDDSMPGSLYWHVDWYNVFAFNVEGVTTWEWFCMLEGKVRSVELRPLENMVVMPKGVTHRVVLQTPFRASISLVSE